MNKQTFIEIIKEAERLLPKEEFVCLALGEAARVLHNGRYVKETPIRVNFYKMLVAGEFEGTLLSDRGFGVVFDDHRLVPRYAALKKFKEACLADARYLEW